MSSSSSSSSSSRDTRGRTSRQDRPNPTRSRTPHLSISLDDIVTIILRLANGDPVTDEQVRQVGRIRRPRRYQVLAQLGDHEVINNAIANLDLMLNDDGENESFQSAVMSLETLQEAAEGARERARADTERARADTERARADTAESRAFPRAEVVLARCLNRSFHWMPESNTTTNPQPCDMIPPSRVLRWVSFDNDIQLDEKLDVLERKNITLSATDDAFTILESFNLAGNEASARDLITGPYNCVTNVIHRAFPEKMIERLPEVSTNVGTRIDVAATVGGVCFCPMELKSPYKVLNDRRYQQPQYISSISPEDASRLEPVLPPISPDICRLYYGDNYVDDPAFEEEQLDMRPQSELSNDANELGLVDVQMPPTNTQLFHAVSQLVAYMLAENVCFGILSTGENTWFCKLDENAKLYVSDAVQSFVVGNRSFTSILYAFLLCALDDFNVRQANQRPIIKINTRTYFFMDHKWANWGSARNRNRRINRMESIFEKHFPSQDGNQNQELIDVLPLTMKEMSIPLLCDHSWTKLSVSQIATTSSVSWRGGIEIVIKFMRRPLPHDFVDLAEQTFANEISMYTGPLRELQGIHIPFMIFGGEFTLSRVMIATVKCGTSLDKLDSRTLSLPGLLAACVKSLKAVHQLGVLHGDIRLANFALLENQTNDLESVKVFLIDFGSASFAPIPYKEAKERQISGDATGAVKRSQQDNMYIVSQYNTADPYAVEMAELHSLFQID